MLRIIKAYRGDAALVDFFYYWEGEREQLNDQELDGGLDGITISSGFFRDVI